MVLFPDAFGAAGHLYDVFFSSVRVLEISRPFFIQKLSL